MSAELNFEVWTEQYNARKEAMRQLMRAALVEGGMIHESWQAHSGLQHITWRLGDNCFMEPWKSDPDYIADHLSSRHFGFGYEMTIGDKTYALGNAA